MAKALKANPTKFWNETLAKDGPIEIWGLEEGDFLYNGTHRFLAALQARVEIDQDC